LLEQVGVAERGHQRDHEPDRPARVALDRDPLGRKGLVELVVGVRARGDDRLELAVDHAVRAVADGGELVSEARVDVRVVAAVAVEPNAEHG
jgi:hypothetical protein